MTIYKWFKNILMRFKVNHAKCIKAIFLAAKHALYPTIFLGHFPFSVWQLTFTSKTYRDGMVDGPYLSFGARLLWEVISVSPWSVGWSVCQLVSLSVGLSVSLCVERCFVTKLVQLNIIWRKCSLILNHFLITHIHENTKMKALFWFKLKYINTKTVLWKKR